MLAKLLAAEGCQVQEAGDGPEALEVWSAHPVDLVITDQRMPGIAGSALCRRLRDEGFAGPIAIAAGADDPQLRTEIADLADVAILRKPVDRAMLRKWLDSGSSAA